jgi:hypothetical protein
MVNYSNGIIYKICCNDTEITDCYIGSTCSFKARKCAHKSSCNIINGRDYNYNVYQFIRANGGWINFSMIQLEAYSAVDKRQLETRERYWIELLKPSLNKNIPTATHQEYLNRNKKKIADYHKMYRIKNNVEIVKKLKIYRTKNKVEIAETKKIYATLNKVELAEKNKIYRNDNKIQLAEKKKIYLDLNRDKIKEKDRIRYHLKFYNKLETFILS